MQIPINLPDPPKLDEEAINSIAKINTKEFKDSYAFKKHCQPYLEQSKKRKWSQFKIFVQKHCLELISVLVAIVFGILALIIK